MADSNAKWFADYAKRDGTAKTAAGTKWHILVGHDRSPTRLRLGNGELFR
jgi:hypothetical protein